MGTEKFIATYFNDSRESHDAISTEAFSLQAEVLRELIADSNITNLMRNLGS